MLTVPYTVLCGKNRVFAQCALFGGSANTVAPLLSILYLFFTSVMNAALLTLILIGAPSFRPQYVFVVVVVVFVVLRKFLIC